ncbi:MAG: hypothetical protein ABFS09_02680 [Thermodesulfobacteriota bacterium]
MFLNPWSLALCLLSGLSIFLIGVACKTAIRVIRQWNPAADSQQQIELESEIWLSSTLVQYGLGFQIISMFLYVLAADSFAQMLSGAMCATGSLLANDYGIPLLVVKIAGMFLYGLWIVLHQLDISSEEYPLVRVKYVLLLFLLPLLVSDTVLLILYLAGLEPDIITSCCAIIFDEGAGGTVQNLFGGRGGEGSLAFYYGWAMLLFCLGFLAWWWQKLAAYLIYGIGVAFFGVLALETLITVFSSYIYAMPFHNCPFCILKKEYGYIGFFIYIPLFVAVFCGITPMLLEPCKRKSSIASTVATMQKKLVVVSLASLAFYVTLSSYHYLAYTLLGGEG